MIGWAKLIGAGLAAALVAAAFWWTYTTGETAGRNAMATSFAKAQDIAIKARDAEQARITKEQQDAAVRGQRARDEAELARAAADDAVDRLRRRAGELAARSCSGAASAADGAPPAGPGLLADVLGRLATAGGRVAAGRDRDRAALAECVERYEALRTR